MKFVEKSKIKQQPLVSKDVTFKAERKPIVGIAYLSKNKYGLGDLFKANKGDRNIIKQFQEFLEKVRNYETVSELKKNHASHNKFKSNDESSQKEREKIKTTYRIDTSDWGHLHCCLNGNGEFVLHGFL